jgi:glycopeptide antibiotics resistance protein
MRSIWRYLTHWDETTVPATQVLGNVLLFLPFGLLAPVRWARLRRLIATLGAAALLALLVEILQFATGQGRVASSDDVILAVIGAGAGWAVSRALALLRPPSARTPSRASPGSPRS